MNLIINPFDDWLKYRNTNKTSKQQLLTAMYVIIIKIVLFSNTHKRLINLSSYEKKGKKL